MPRGVPRKYVSGRRPAGDKPRPPLQRTGHAARVAELYLEGKTFMQIADELQMTYQRVYKSMQIARELWRTRAADSIARHKEREITKLDVVELEAWRGWQRSIGVVTIETVKNKTEDEINFDERTTRSEPHAGDPRFLAIITTCVEQRRRLLGLDAPTQVSVTGLENIADILANRASRMELPEASYDVPEGQKPS
jgi:hypothetical protein